MKVKFTTLRVQADSRGLIALHLPTAATLQIQSPNVWLTHSLSRQDYVLPQGTKLSLMAGTVLIEGDNALVEVQASSTSRVGEWLSRARRWFNGVQSTSCAVCVKAA